MVGQLEEERIGEDTKESSQSLQFQSLLGNVLVLSFHAIKSSSAELSLVMKMRNLCFMSIVNYMSCHRNRSIE